MLSPLRPPAPSRTELSLLAWAGWQMEMPGEWRPLKIKGTPAKGSMIVGDALCAMFSVHWERVKGGRLPDGQGWIKERLKRQGLLPDPTPPAAENFSACAWAHGVQTEEDKKTTYWYGYSARAELVMGVKVNGVLPADQLAQITHQVLLSIRTSPLTAESAWAMYDFSFMAPPGFQMRQKHLFAGDVALEFRKGRTESLLLRQVYPGDLALARRSFEKWLAASPFKEHRRIKPAGLRIEPWRRSPRKELTGIERHGTKRLGFPLGMVRPRWTHALCVHDQKINRLLIAEHLAPAHTDEAICETAIAHMNLPLREGV